MTRCSPAHSTNVLFVCFHMCVCVYLIAGWVSSHLHALVALCLRQSATTESAMRSTNCTHCLPQSHVHSNSSMWQHG